MWQNFRVALDEMHGDVLAAIAIVVALAAWLFGSGKMKNKGRLKLVALISMIVVLGLIIMNSYDIIQNRPITTPAPSVAIAVSKKPSEIDSEHTSGSEQESVSPTTPPPTTPLPTTPQPTTPPPTTPPPTTPPPTETNGPGIGSIISFGSYPQDQYGTVTTPIEWRVLERKGDLLFVISQYGLDARAFNPSFGTTWEKSEIRDWLNHEFLETAFTDSERALIQNTYVSPDSNVAYNTDQGSATQDYIFLLSATEASLYFNNNKDRQCKPTDYADEQADYEDDEDLEFCWWWLRTMGENNDKAVFVSARKGDVALKGDGVRFTAGTVRPAMWVKWAQ